MDQIKSKVTGEVLHIICRSEDIKSGREDIILPNNVLQCSVLKLISGTTFRPHKHIHRKKYLNYIVQESWIVISGRIKCVFYDIDNKILREPILYPGDASFTLAGGHTYEILDDAVVYEYKTGPYEGQEKDKVFID